MVLAFYRDVGVTIASCVTLVQLKLANIVVTRVSRCLPEQVESANAVTFSPELTSLVSLNSLSSSGWLQLPQKVTLLKRRKNPSGTNSLFRTTAICGKYPR